MFCFQSDTGANVLIVAVMHGYITE